MQQALPADPSQDFWSHQSTSTRRAKNLMVAGVAAAGASVLAVTPVTVSPTMPDLRNAAVELSAFADPIAEWQQTLTNTFTVLDGLGASVSTASGKLTDALANPALHAEVAEFLLSSATNPLPILAALASFQADYGDRIGAASADFSEAIEIALAELPAVLQLSAGHLAEGNFLEAFGEINTWFLVSILSDGRQSVLDVLAIPGDFADSIGATTAARVLDSVLNRTVVGNLGRALLAPQVTAIIQTAEILGRTQAAIQAGDLETAASELINAPALVVNAFLNGYVPDFTVDPQWPPQVFPGIFSPRGTFDFFLNQIPTAVAGALTPPAAQSLARVSSEENLVTLSLDSADVEAAPAPELAPVPEVSAPTGPSDSIAAVAFEAEEEDDSETSTPIETDDDASPNDDDDAAGADDDDDSTGDDDESGTDDDSDGDAKDSGEKDKDSSDTGGADTGSNSSGSDSGGSDSGGGGSDSSE